MSYILATLGLISLYLGGRGYWWGWLVGLVSQAFWAFYAVDTQQYGFLASACFYAGGYFMNARRERLRGLQAG